ncbi:MAG: hypothetical protein F2555_05005 [Actinobacteria bacterium]|uniref:Unannotated protein n=1 Tax=freshwater metagenome TaxID=449393 RepID=A0A6J6EHW6_9ZZZZ|nr:hypothetical protein [Actinomycetota bacterium]
MAKGKVRRYADYYCDDPVVPVVKRRNFGAFGSSVILIVAGLFLSNTYAANISLSSGAGVEFGQGVSLTTACSGSQALTVTPYSSFVNSSGAGSYYFGSVTVSNIPSTCFNTKLQINAYTSSGTSPLALYNTSTADVIVGNNAGSYEAMGTTAGISVVTNSSSSFTVTFTSPVAPASDVSRVTIQSSSTSFAYAPTRGIQFPPMSGLSLSTGLSRSSSFTIEGWIRSSDWSETRALMPYVGNACEGLLLTSLSATRWVAGVTCNNMQVEFAMPGSTSMINNQWMYMAFVRDSNGTSLFIDGAKLTATSTNNGGSLVLPLSGSTDNASIGEWTAYNTATQSSRNGIIGEIRLSNMARVASTSSSFNPSYAPSGRATGQLASDANTTMLLRPPVSGNTFVDSSGNQTLTVVTSISGPGTPTPPIVVNFG